MRAMRARQAAARGGGAKAAGPPDLGDDAFMPSKPRSLPGVQKGPARGPPDIGAKVCVSTTCIHVHVCVCVLICVLTCVLMCMHLCTHTSPTCYKCTGDDAFLPSKPRAGTAVQKGPARPPSSAAAPEDEEEMMKKMGFGRCMCVYVVYAYHTPHGTSEGVFVSVSVYYLCVRVCNIYTCVCV